METNLKWENDCIPCAAYSALVYECNHRGEDGWEVASFIYNGDSREYLVWLKRPKRETPAPPVRTERREFGILPGEKDEIVVSYNTAPPAPPAEPVKPVTVEEIPRFTDPSGRPERRSPNDMDMDEFIRQGRD